MEIKTVSGSMLVLMAVGLAKRLPMTNGHKTSRLDENNSLKMKFSGGVIC